MVKKEKTIGSEFCSDLYDVLCYSTMTLLNDEENQFQKEIFDYTELFEHFSEIADKFIILKRLCDAYDELSPELVGFAITKDIKDFDIKFSLDNKDLLKLRDKIDKQIKYNAEHYNDIADETEKQEVRTREELLLDFCDYLIENVPNIEYLNKENVNRLVLIENFLEEERIK